jgi:DNA-binding transcriptional ArsR family regulator
MFENIAVADLAIGRSTVRQRILALLMSESVGRLHLREIQRRARTSPGTASRELARLVAAGLIEREAEGAQVYFRASASPFATMMRSLLIIAPAPADELPRPGRLPRAKTNAPKPAELAGSTAELAGSTAEPALEPATEIRDSMIEAATIEAPPATANPEHAESAGADQEGRPAQATRTEPTAETIPPRVFRPTNPDAVRPAWSAVPDLTAEAPAEHPHTADLVGLQIARRLAESVESLYAESGRLRGVYLCGERAAGSARPDADVETVIVLDRVDHYGAELERTSHLCAALSHELKLIVSRVFVFESDWLHRTDGSLPTVRAGAVEI